MFSYGMTDIGKCRASNQDSFIIDRISPSTVLAVVCDGMGGAAGGLEASSTACSVFADSVEAGLDRLTEKSKEVTPSLCVHLLHRGVDLANAAVAARAVKEPELSGMGTTLVAALILGGRVYVANVGDSRLYSVKDGVLSQVTHDHSFVQLLIDTGRISEEEARFSENRNIITRAVGTSPEVRCDIFTINELPDAILLCTDGLTNMLTPEEIGERFLSGVGGEDELRDVCQALIDAANDEGGRDNITAAIVSFAPDESDADEEEEPPMFENEPDGDEEAAFADEAAAPIDEEDVAAFADEDAAASFADEAAASFDGGDGEPEAEPEDTGGLGGLDTELEALIHFAEGLGGKEPSADGEPTE